MRRAPAWPLLAGLEHKLDGARQLVAMAVQEMHRRDQHGRVRIMAAGVHASGDFAGKLEPRFFRHRQRVMSPRQPGSSGHFCDPGLVPVSDTMRPDVDCPQRDPSDIEALQTVEHRLGR